MRLKEKIKQRELTIGSWITIAHPAIAEIMAKAGFDWLVVDLEHSVITIREAEELIRIIDLCNVAPLVRLSFNDPVQIKRVMDAGAHGIIIPMVNLPIEAEDAVRSVYYPPRGRRGVGLARAQGYGSSFEAYKNKLSEETVVIVQTEHVMAVENLKDILAIDDVDGFIVGPYDLSGSLGIPGQFENSQMKKTMSNIITIGKDSNKVMGIHVIEPDEKQLIERIDEGYKFIAYSVDIRMLDVSCRMIWRKLPEK